MTDISLPVVARDTLSQLARRSNWAGENAGVMVVFCIVFVVAVALIFLVVYKKLKARKALRSNHL